VTPHPALFTLVPLLGLSAISLAQVRYSFTDLGDLQGGLDQSFAAGVSNTGFVTGASSYATDGSVQRFHAFRWSESTGMVELSTILNRTRTGNFYSAGEAVNDAGVVVGQATGAYDEAFRCPPDTNLPLSLGPGRFGANNGFAKAVNSTGMAVGFINSSSGRNAFRWTASTGIVYMNGVDTTQSLAYALNESGQAAGFYPVSGNGALAVRWDANNTPVSLGRLLPGGSIVNSIAYGMNDAGWVVGQSLVAEDFIRAFQWTPESGMINLGIVPGTTHSTIALDINNNNWAVGTASFGALGERGVLWFGINDAHDLNTMIDASGAGWIIRSATGINDLNEIAANAQRISDGVTHAVLLRPLPPCIVDFNHDGSVNPDDLADYIGCYFTIPSCSAADFNGDGTVDPDDLADYVTEYFSSGC